MQGGVSRPSGPILKFNRDDLKGLPFKFPAKIVRLVYHYLQVVFSLILLEF